MFRRSLLWYPKMPNRNYIYAIDFKKYASIQNCFHMTFRYNIEYRNQITYFKVSPTILNYFLR